MNPTYLTIFGLVVDVIGAFFLSAEAIRLENLRRFRDQWLVPFIEKMGILKAVLALGTSMIFLISISEILGYEPPAWVFWIYLWSSVALMVVYVFEKSVDVLNFIDVHTQGGVVGIIGFALMVSGFSLQLIGTAMTL